MKEVTNYLFSDLSSFFGFGVGFSKGSIFGFFSNPK
jgi:hypothetical protein